MARINIEEEAHKRVSKLAGLAKCSDREALGTVSFLWGDSQDILKTHGSRDEIIEWAHLFNLSDEDVERWILALKKSRFISCLDDGQYLIHGNEVQIENRLSKLARATKGAKATKKKWSELKRLGAGLKPSSSTPKARDSHAQRGSSQAKPSQSKPRQANAEIGAAAPPTAQSVIAFYYDTWKEVHNADPPKNGSNAGILARLVKENGADRTLHLVRAYFAMPDPWVKKTAHDVKVLATKLNEVAKFADSGAFVTMTAVRKADEDVHHRQENLKALEDLPEEKRQDYLDCFEDTKPTPKEITGGVG
jgi:hypothetical protein